MRRSELREAEQACNPVLSGSLPPGVSPAVYAELSQSLSARDAMVCIDAGGESLALALQERPWLVKPNRAEAEGLLGSSVNTLAEGVEAARKIADLGAQHVLLSLGAAGAVLWTPTGYAWGSAPRVRVINPTGCGDCMLAVTAAATGKKSRRSLAV